MRNPVRYFFKRTEAPNFFDKKENPQMYLGLTSGGEEIWIDRTDAGRHILLTGSTGSGKTNLILNMLSGALSRNQGFLCIDGKGDGDFYARAKTISAAYGRNHDFLHLDFTSQGKNKSHTFNPFQTMSADSIVHMLVSTMEGRGGDSAMWAGRSTAMLTAIIRALVWLRDEDRLDLTPMEIRDYVNLKKIIELVDPQRNPDLPFGIRKSLKAYLCSLPGFQEEKGYKQSQTTIDQHGYLEMMWTRSLSLLADSYGHIFNTANPDIDFKDVISNRRILIVSLPGMAKELKDTEFLGRFLVSGIRNGLFDVHTEKTQNMTECGVSLPQQELFPCVFDEVSSYMVDGMDLLASQSRSMGFSLIFSAQTIEAIISANPHIASYIIGNTNTKIFMQSETLDQDTLSQFMEKFRGAFGTSVMEIVSGFQPGEFLVTQGGEATLGRAPEITVNLEWPERKMTRLIDHKDVAAKMALEYLKKPHIAPGEQAVIQTSQFEIEELPKYFLELGSLDDAMFQDKVSYGNFISSKVLMALGQGMATKHSKTQINLFEQ